MLVQIAGLAANYTLRAWGEHNREEGSNKGVGVYLLGYGLFSLVSIIIGMISTIVLWVFCAVRSSQYLHDAVSFDNFVFWGEIIELICYTLDVACCHACSYVILRTNPDGSYFELVQQRYLRGGCSSREGECMSRLFAIFYDMYWQCLLGHSKCCPDLLCDLDDCGCHRVQLPSIRK